MPGQGHRPEWPDKAMFAALLLILGGFLGTLFELLRGAVSVDNGRLPVLVAEWPHAASLAGALATLVLGIACLRTQAAMWGYLGAACAVASLAFFGLVPFLGVAAVFLLIRSHVEGEETRNDGVRLHGGKWPDKAMAASLLLFVGGALAGMQGFAIALGRFDPIIVKGTPAVAAILDVAAGLLCLAASHETFHLRRPWMGRVGAILCIATLGLYVLGPLLGTAALVLLRLAHGEREFTEGEPEAA